jgi:exodeoxyribonuclease V alpha subunit
MLWNWFFGDGKVADKVIQIRNNYNKWVYDVENKKWREKYGVFNGMMGYAYSIRKWNKAKKKYETKTIVRFYYPEIEAYTDEKEMEHAYAITIHKSQGSGFENVILIIPKGLNKFISKEMLYTAITRAKKRLYIIVEEDIENFLNVSVSELAKRKTNLFENFNLSYLIPYFEERQIITINGEKVRSWQECVLANLFHEAGIEYTYEPLSEYLKIGLLPDFKLNIKNKTILWEHYGMLENREYRERQNEKELLYKQAGFKIIKLSEINENTNFGDKVLITSTSEDLKDNNQVLQKLKILQEIS